MTHEELQAIKARAAAASMVVGVEEHDELGRCQGILSTDVPALVAEVERLRKALLKRGVAECYQCGTILDDDNRHISGLMCIPCALPVMDYTTP